MTRIRLSIFILLLVLSLSIYSMFIIKYKCSELLNLIDKAQIQMENNQQIEAIETAKEINEYWNKLYKICCVLVKGEKITAVYSSISKLKPYIESNSEELYTEFEICKGMVNWLYESEMPHLHNIF